MKFFAIFDSFLMNYEKSSNIENEENLTLFTFIQITTLGTKSVHSAGPT